MIAADAVNSVSGIIYLPFEVPIGVVEVKVETNVAEDDEGRFARLIGARDVDQPFNDSAMGIANQ